MTEEYFEEVAEKFKREVGAELRATLKEVITQALKGHLAEEQGASLAHIQKNDPQFAKAIHGAVSLAVGEKKKELKEARAKAMQKQKAAPKKEDKVDLKGLISDLKSSLKKSIQGAIKETVKKAVGEKKSEIKAAKEKNDKLKAESTKKKTEEKAKKIKEEKPKKKKDKKKEDDDEAEEGMGASHPEWDFAGPKGKVEEGDDIDPNERSPSLKDSPIEKEFRKEPDHDPITSHDSTAKTTAESIMGDKE